MFLSLNELLAGSLNQDKAVFDADAHIVRTTFDPNDTDLVKPSIHSTTSHQDRKLKAGRDHMTKHNIKAINDYKNHLDSNELKGVYCCRVQNPDTAGSLKCLCAFSTKGGR